MTEEGDIKKEGMDEDMPLSNERAASPLAPYVPFPTQLMTGNRFMRIRISLDISWITC